MASEHWRSQLYQLVVETRSPQGRVFNLLIYLCTIASVLTVVLGSVQSWRQSYGSAFNGLEWGFTLIFSMDYCLRLIAAPHARRYAFSFFGLVDLITILPTYFSALLPGFNSLLILRSLQLLRIFRVLKLFRFAEEANQLWRSLRSSIRRITVFLCGVFILQLIIASLIFSIEGSEHGFDSIPKTLYWTIVTMTTVGYGDLTPQTPLGRLLASGIMLLGYGIIAVPSGFVAYDLAHLDTQKLLACHHCGAAIAVSDARFCHQCGQALTADVHSNSDV
ncbi:ion transporter [Synechococcus elongatus]|uniref:Ion transporter n=1 Tax=Synechococcus elongatus PCC 11801 TaxID=2219813 RepID=A0AAN1QN80_SYNEL|nr:ion transporter [Synechococcus elongatus]AZB72396.1 potassium channel protein [Synechococcus elongatus PCC 11801]